MTNTTLKGMPRRAVASHRKAAFSFLLPMALCMAFGASAATRTFPDFSWGQAKIARSEKGITIKGPDGTAAFSVYMGDRSALPAALVVSNAAEALVLDFTAVTLKEKESVILRSGDFVAADLAGRDAVLRTCVGGTRGYVLDTIVAGPTLTDSYNYRAFKTKLKARAVDYDMVETWPAFTRFHFRWDFHAPAKGQTLGRIFFKRAQFGSLTDLPSQVVTTAKEVKETFHLTFDDELGYGSAVKRQGVASVPGFRGKGAHFSSRDRSVLEYAAQGRVDAESGTLTFWFRPDWKDDLAWNGAEHTVFSYPPRTMREREVGTGELWCWWWGPRFRGDLGDDTGLYCATDRIPQDGAFHHFAYTWGPFGVRLYRDGKRLCKRALGPGPVRGYDKFPPEPYTFARKVFTRFALGGNGASGQVDGTLDEVRLFSGAMDERQVAAAYAADANPYEGPARDVGGQFGVRRLVASVDFTSDTVPRLRRERRFRSEGKLAYGTCEGRSFLIADESRGRFGVTFALPTNAPLYLFEIDYPDDVKRTADIVIQRALTPKQESTMEVGYATGDEIPNSGKMLTHRCLYWISESPVAVIAMSPREDQNAAIASIRVYALEDRTLPVAKVTPPARKDGWERMFGIHFEDISIGYCFATPKTTGFSEEEQDAMIDRCAATMKFTGQNLLCYPGAWYGDLMCRDGYDPRHNHAANYRRRWYEKFDREGLFFIPTVHGDDMPTPEGLVNRRSVRDGSLHDSILSIHDTGMPNSGLSYSVASVFSFDHPAVKERIRDIILTLTREGYAHPSFKGVSLHLAGHYYLWWGGADGGYNDYTIAHFTRDTGIAVPTDKTDPMRGKAYFAWLKAHAWEKWLDWRCREVAEFYGALAKEMSALRPDLRLVLNSFQIVRIESPDLYRPDYMRLQNREAGIDPDIMRELAPQVILVQTDLPCDYRWRRDFRYPKASIDKAKAWLRNANSTREYFGLLDGSTYGGVNLHDIYWEDVTDYGHIPWKRPADPALRFDSAELKDNPWRVTTINPGGVQAMRQFAVPLYNRDVQWFTKGGFLIGTYGMEEWLVPFMQAFRSLPPVPMEDVKDFGGVKLRRVTYDGRTYYALVSGVDKARSVRCPFVGKVRDTVSGETYTDASAITLPPYALKAFVSER